MDIDWYAIGVIDKAIQDALDSEEKESRFTPVKYAYHPPKVIREEGYNAFDSMSEEEIEWFRIREK
jgi:hypothetical protein